MNNIDPHQVEAAFMDCLFLPEEITGGAPPDDAVIVEGILNKFAFNPQRLEKHREEVQGWIELLPNEFRKTGGGGWSFLNACNQQNGEQWTGLHVRMDQLLSMAMGLSLAAWILPREMWSVLPGSMPYVQIEC